MRKLFCLLCVFALSLCACKKADTPTETTPTANTAPTVSTTPTQPTSPTVPAPSGPTTFQYGESFGTNVTEFLTLLRTLHPDWSDNNRNLSEKNCYNVTPPEVFAETNMQIFFSPVTYRSYILLDNQTEDGSSSPEIHKAVGDFVSAIPWDIDSDGHKDLLYSHSFGSGIPYRAISLFNPVSKENTRIFTTSKLIYTKELFLTKSASNVYFEGKPEAAEQLAFPVWEVDFENIYKKEDDRSVLIGNKYTVTGIHGHIAVTNGIPTFIPYEK